MVNKNTGRTHHEAVLFLGEYLFCHVSKMGGWVWYMGKYGVGGKVNGCKVSVECQRIEYAENVTY